MANVLIFDDSTDILEMLHAMLKTYGHTPVTVCDKNVFVKELQQMHTDIILLDINLKNHDGREICHEIKNTETTKHIPVILMSANPKFLQTYKEYCADAIIDKPFEMDKMIQLISSFTVNS